MNRIDNYLSQSTTIGTPVEFSQQQPEFSQAACFDIFSGVSPQKGQGKSDDASLKVVVKPVISKAKSMIFDFNAKCMQPRAQPLPLGETRQCKITEFFKSEKKPQNPSMGAQLRMPAAPKVYSSDKISYYFRSHSNNNEW